MSLKQQDPFGPLVAAHPNPERTDIEHNPEIETLLQLSADTLWQQATVLHSSATERGITFKGLQEYEAVDCLQHYLAAISLRLEQAWLQEKAPSVRVQRTGAGVCAHFPSISIDFSDLAGRMAIGTKRLSPADSGILRDVTIDLLFDDVIKLPGFDRDVVDGDTFDLTLQPDNLEREKRQQRQN